MPDFSQPERRGLERMQRPQTAQTHPDADLLAAFSEQTLSARVREQVLLHLSGCESCREVAALAFPETAEVSTAKTAASPSFWKWPVMRWGTVASSAVIVVVAVSIGISDREQRAAKLSNYSSEAAPSARTAAPAPAEEDFSANKAAAGKQADQFEKRPETKAARAVGSPSLASVPIAVPPQPLNSVSQTAVLDRAEVATKRDRDKDLRAPNELAGASGGVISDVAPAKKEAGSLHGVIVAAPIPAMIAREAAPPLPPSTARADANYQDVMAKASVNGPSPQAAKPALPATGETVEVKNDAAAVQPDRLETKQSSASAITTETISAANYRKLAPSLAKSSDLKSPDLNLKDERAKNSVAESSASLTASTAMQYNSLSTEWRVTPQGDLLNSTDLGRNWVQQLPGQKFTHVQSVRNHIWASSPNGVLMHSTDAGQTWTQANPSQANAAMQGEIISINFADENRGVVKTSAHETWSTIDGGKSWRKQ